MASVEFVNAGKRFGDVVAVHDVNLSIDDGEFVVLVGPSGCGKSTTLRMLAGLEEISDGELLIDGREVSGIHPKDRDIAMVFQSYALYPHMTVQENMSFGLRMQKMPKDEIKKRVAHAAGILELEELLSRKPRELSGGQRQRVAMGRAIVREPKVFLFDEPLSNLDAKLRVQMRAGIARLHRRIQTTVVYVTHDQVEAMTLADRMVVMNKGRIQQVGAPLEVFNRPRNRFVAGFIGSPEMNFLEGVLEEGGCRLSGQGYQLSLPAEVQARLQGREGVVSLGYRACHVRLLPPSLGEFGMPATVEVLEPLGAELQVTVSLAGSASAVVTCDPQQALRLGESVWLELDPEHLYLFDGKTEEALY